MLRRLDMWLGKTLFVPLIIRVCQRAKMTQYAFSHYAWVVAIFCLMAKTPHGVVNWIIYGFVALSGALMVAFAAVAPDQPQPPLGLWFRCMVVIFFLTADVLPLLLAGWKTVDVTTPYFPIVMFADYALTITTIPPLESKEQKRATKMAKQHV